jgi:hypothetical protein
MMDWSIKQGIFVIVRSVISKMRNFIRKYMQHLLVVIGGSESAVSCPCDIALNYQRRLWALGGGICNWSTRPASPWLTRLNEAVAPMTMMRHGSDTCCSALAKGCTRSERAVCAALIRALRPARRGGDSAVLAFLTTARRALCAG